MTRKIFIANPEFIQTIKAQIEAKKARHRKYYSEIKVGTATKLKNMKSE